MMRGLTLVALLLAGVAHAQDAAPRVCSTDDDGILDGAAYLRALSLDLRGVVPRAEEYDLLEDGEVPASLIDAWLDEPSFGERVVRHHDSLLWPNVGDIRLMSNR